MTLDEMVLEWQIADAALKIAKENFDKKTNDLASYMLVEGIKSDLVNVRGTDYKVTVVQTERVKVDEDSLVKSIGRRLYNKVTTRKVDTKLLECAIRDGWIDQDTIANSMVVSKSTPYMRVTKYTGEPE